MIEQPLTGSIYDRDYYIGGTKSAYSDYGPGGWADDLTALVLELRPDSVLDVGCAYGFVVQRLRALGIEANGFDISEFAIGRGDSSYLWIGDAADETSYIACDLILASELPEHLTEAQARLFLRHARRFGRRALLLICVDTSEVDHGPAPDAGDVTHINVRPMPWWVREAREAGWQIGDSTQINADPRSEAMAWAGRFLYLEQPNSE